MESEGFCPAFFLGYYEDLFSVESMTVAWTVKNVVCFAFHFWNRSWIIHCEALLQRRKLSLLFKKKKCFLLLRTFYRHKFWTVSSCELFLTPCSWCFTGKMCVIVSAFISFPIFSVGVTWWTMLTLSIQLILWKEKLLFKSVLYGKGNLYKYI